MAEIVGENALSSQGKGQSAIESEDDQSSFSSEETQTGVKTIEAVSQTWTRWSLIAAYLG
jgi:hypothetical protein